MNAVSVFGSVIWHLIRAEPIEDVAALLQSMAANFASRDAPQFPINSPLRCPMRLLTRLESLERKVALPGGQCQCNDSASVSVYRIGSTHHAASDPMVIPSVEAAPANTRCPNCNRLRTQIIVQYTNRLPQPV